VGKGKQVAEPIGHGRWAECTDKEKAQMAIDMHYLKSSPDRWEPSLNVGAFEFSVKGLAGWIVYGADDGGRPIGQANFNTVCLVYYSQGY
jgi:hypothetical protein